ncbi:hypothetical protein MASR2M15_26040 [Anaerolineales bacterium]
MASNFRIIPPPRDQQETSSYRSVWNSIIIELSILTIICGLIFIPKFLIGFSLPVSIHSYVNLALVLTPTIVWLGFSYLKERSVPQPRRRLLGVFIISILTANAIGIPLVEGLLQLETWLSHETAFMRIFGYTVAYGVIHMGLIYLVQRYTVWATDYRNRLDVVAYCLTAAIAYVSVINFHYFLGYEVSPDVMAIRLLSNMAMFIGGSLFLSYGIALTYFDNALSPVMPIYVFVSAFIAGGLIPIRSGLANAGLSTTISTTKPLLVFAFSIGILFICLSLIMFLFNSKEHREAERLKTGL